MCRLTRLVTQNLDILSGAMNVLILRCFFFFICVCVHECRNNASISNYGGGFRWQNESSWCIGEVILEIPNSFQKYREKQKKN
ncbi:Uncharacterized protein FWK35_00032317 [Aphis craccivora]|uniref:Uncharacterized protein n=1 Tax=Aphis craccivora TaxID=307492 RepID=A0A6G0VTC9_APHCR|nr:Uncharacterized protein FWK35_00032317 [Aphis craccivora]